MSDELHYGRAGGLDAAEAEVAVVRAIYDAFARLDVEAALARCHETVTMNVPGTAALAGRPGVPYTGHAGIRQFFADAGRVWDDLALHAHDIRASAGAVVVFGHVEGVADGQRVAREVVWLWRVRDGLAVSVQVSDLREADR